MLKDLFCSCISELCLNRRQQKCHTLSLVNSTRTLFCRSLHSQDVLIMVPHSYFTPNLRTSQTDITIFGILLFISLNLLFISLYSVYRESYAVDPKYLRRIRFISVLNTILQISCVTGYWLNIYAVYECSWILWLTLSTFCITSMGIKIGESYIILVSTNYKLNDHRSIPRKYRIFVYLFWGIGSLIDATGRLLDAFL